MSVGGISSSSVARTYYSNLVTKTLSNLSSGSDSSNASSVAISSTLSSMISSGDSASGNIANSVSSLQTSSGYLDSVGNDMELMKKLAVQAQSGTLSSDDLTSVKSQFKTLQNDITSITSNYNASATYNGNTLLQGSSYQVQTGASQGQTTQIDTPNLTVQNNSQIGTVDTYTYDSSNAVTSSTHTAVKWGDVLNSVTGLDVTSADATGVLDKAIGNVASAKSSTSTDISALVSNYGSLDTYDSNLSSAYSMSSDVDMASETMALTKELVMAKSNSAVQTQANSLSTLSMQLALLNG